MRLAVCSDLHLDMNNITMRDIVHAAMLLDPDALIIAGDLASGPRTVYNYLWGTRGTPFSLIYVSGNHDGWGSSVQELSTMRHRLHQNAKNVHWLENSSVHLGKVQIHGTTLWHRKPKKVRGADGREYTPWLMDVEFIERHAATVGRRNGAAVRFLRKAVKPGDIVVTHHLPSYLSVSQQYKNDSHNESFVSPQDQLIADLRPALWIHGHTHTPCDYMLHDTRVFCNPYGYERSEPQPSRFRLEVVEV